jgi:hypothetical protein
MSIHLHAVECNHASVATMPICTSTGISNAPDTYNSHCTEDLTCVLEDYGQSHTLVVVIKHKILFCSLICFNSRMGHGCFFRDLSTSPTADLSYWKDRCYIYEGSYDRNAEMTTSREERRSSNVCLQGWTFQSYHKAFLSQSLQCVENRCQPPILDITPHNMIIDSRNLLFDLSRPVHFRTLHSQQPCRYQASPKQSKTLSTKSSKSQHIRYNLI